MNILVINQPLNNRGDESAHKGLLRKIVATYPDANIKVLYINSDISDSVHQFNPHFPNVEYKSVYDPFAKLSGKFFRLGYPLVAGIIAKIPVCSFAQYKWADVVVCAPGGICMGGFQNWGHLFQLWLAKKAHKPLYYYGRSFGPFPIETKYNRRFKKYSAAMLDYMSFLLLRDKKSEALAQSMGLKYSSTVDSAFLDSPSADFPYELRHMRDIGEYMVFVPNYLLWHYAYKGKFTTEDVVDFYTNMARRILEANPKQKIVMLPQTFQYGTFAGDDINIFRKIAESINDDRVIILPDCYSSDIQQKIVSKANYVVGARYHSIVFAINQNRPFVSLSYEHKMTGLLETLGMTDTMIDFSHVMESAETREQCIEEFSKMIANLKYDATLQTKAKSIAEKGFKNFELQLNKDCTR